ncbi:type II CRISPR-associated endonuclease Cas1 [Elioraea thermophila]|uniref:type II CRISPR-associated endonuclease Cas1 n=1 Tax=Elioraea thermophila TaxID=2185104 RepID=UPI000DF31B7B|nr:type II CRISPR-associated endonuclease Cas1 [Elioraea thermophila]
MTRTVVVSSPARLSLRHRQLVVARADGSSPTVPLEDLALLLVEEPQATYTHALLAALMEAKAALVVCGADHMPAGVLLPYQANALAGERQRAQLGCPRPLAKRLWQAIVAAKLRRQADLLRRAAGSDLGLAAMARRVRSGDPENLEAQGAQRYWPALFGSGFRRDRTGEGANRLLNYGYAVLRAATARAVVAAGLLPALGLFHANRGDAFALASDLMEPYRPFVDGVVWDLAQAGRAEGALDREVKAHLLGVLNLAVGIEGKAMPLGLALGRSAASLAASFGARRVLLRLPENAEGLPAADGGDDGGSDGDATPPEAAPAP